MKTLLKGPGARDEVYDFVEREVGKGRQAYLVYPLVESSEKVDLRAATEEWERLSEETFPHRSVGLLHGQMPGEEKDRIMREFLAGDIDVLVATTVVEVGIDVPNASLMVIEHAERFGLSQLHQLRGRVGRGSAETTDGFAIAKADLRIRGQGDLFGSQQSGRDPLLRFADLTRDEDLLLRAQALARRVVEADPELARPEFALLKGVLEARHAHRLKMYEMGA